MSVLRWVATWDGTVLCAGLWGAAEVHIHKKTHKNIKKKKFWSYLTQKACAISCFSPGKAQGSAGWRNCQVLVILTKARAFSSTIIQSFCFIRPRVYPRLLQKRVLYYITVGGPLCLHTEIFKNRCGTRNCMAFWPWRLVLNQFLCKKSWKEHGHSFLLLFYF